MKTHVRTNLRVGKLALLFATTFTVAVISVVGFASQMQTQTMQTIKITHLLNLLSP